MKLALVIAALMLTGCAAVPPPSDSDLAGADYGPPVANYQEVIKKRMASVLKDPGSAIYEFSMEPVKAWYARGDVRYYGYAVCAHINAKNSYGGYTGQRKSYFFMRDGYVIDDHHAGEPGSLSEQVVYNSCSRL